MKDMSFQEASPMPLSSVTLLDLLILILLLLMYLVIGMRDSLMYLKSDRRYSNKGK